MCICEWYLKAHPQRCFFPPTPLIAFSLTLFLASYFHSLATASWRCFYLHLLSPTIVSILCYFSSLLLLALCNALTKEPDVFLSMIYSDAKIGAERLRCRQKKTQLEFKWLSTLPVIILDANDSWSFMNHSLYLCGWKMLHCQWGPYIITYIWRQVQK